MLEIVSCVKRMHLADMSRSSEASPLVIHTCRPFFSVTKLDHGLMLPHYECDYHKAIPGEASRSRHSILGLLHTVAKD